MKMTTQYLSQLGLPIECGLYLDCGALFPFFMKQSNRNLNLSRWAGDICCWLKQTDLYTTTHIIQEVDKAYNAVPMNKKVRKQITPLYQKIVRTINKDVILVEDTHRVLSAADRSLLRRKRIEVPLLTSDKALYRSDPNSILLLWDERREELSFTTERVV
jgi:hypothetical protein